MIPMLHDPTPHRVSACPVHFLWDGRGRGRLFVRSGFLGFVVAAMVGVGASLLRIEGSAPFTLAVLGVAGASWTFGQVLSFLALPRARRG